MKIAHFALLCFETVLRLFNDQMILQALSFENSEEKRETDSSFSLPIVKVNAERSQRIRLQWRVDFFPGCYFHLCSVVKFLPNFFFDFLREFFFKTVHSFFKLKLHSSESGLSSDQIRSRVRRIPLHVQSRIKQGETQN